ncbi:MAG: hypothetical protein WCT36_00520 [Candidatus Gracilibacteria bacterium]
MSKLGTALIVAGLSLGALTVGTSEAKAANDSGRQTAESSEQQANVISGKSADTANLAGKALGVAFFAAMALASCAGAALPLRKTAESDDGLAEAEAALGGETEEDMGNRG